MLKTKFFVFSKYSVPQILKMLRLELPVLHCCSALLSWYFFGFSAFGLFFLFFQIFFKKIGFEYG
jgi:hypothetical protein